MEDELIDEPDDLFDDYEALDQEEEENAEGGETAVATNEAETGEKIEAPKRRVIRNPRLKFDADRLCGERGIPILIDHYSCIKFKGKGHEVQNLDRLLAILEHWTHRLFPSMKFADSLRQIEKLGKKRAVQVCVGKIRMDMPILNSDFGRVEDEEEDTVRRGTDPDPEVNHGTEFDHLVEDYQRTRDNDHHETIPEDDFHPTSSSSLLNEPSTSGFNGITEEQRLKIEQNRRLAAERLRARLSNLNSALSSTTSSVASSDSIATTSVISETLSVELQMNTFSNPQFDNNEEDANFDSGEIRKPTKRLRIDSDDDADIDDLVENSLYDDADPTLTSRPSCHGTSSTFSNRSQSLKKTQTVWQKLNEYDGNKGVSIASQNHYRSGQYNDENSDSGIDGDSVMHHRSKKKRIIESDDEGDDMHQAESNKRLANGLNPEKDDKDRDNASHNIPVLSNLSEVENNINSSLPDKNADSINSTTNNEFQSKIANNGQDDEDSNDSLFEYKKSGKKFRIDSDDEDDDMSQAGNAKKMPNILDLDNDNVSHNISVSSSLLQVEKNVNASLPDESAESTCSTTTDNFQQAVKKKQEDEDSDDGLFKYKKSAKKFRIDSDSDDEDDDMSQADSAKKMPNILDLDNDNVSLNISVSSSLSQVENNVSSSLSDKSAESPCSTTTDDFHQAVKKKQEDEDSDDGLFKYKKSAKKFRIDSDDEDDDMSQAHSAKKMPNILDLDNVSHNISVSSNLLQVKNNVSSSLPDKSAESPCSTTTDDFQQAVKKKQEDEDSDDGLFKYKKSAKKFRIDSDDEDDDMSQADSAKKMPNILDLDNDNISHNISVSSNLSQVKNNLSSSLPDKSAESPCSTTTDDFQQAVKKKQEDEDSDDGLFKYKKSAKKFRIDSGDDEDDDMSQADSAKKMPNILDLDNDNVSHNISVSSNLSQVKNNVSSSLPDKSTESPCSTTTDDFQQAVKKKQEDEDSDDGLFKYKKSTKKFRIDSDDEDDDMGQADGVKKIPNILDLDDDNVSHNISVSSSLSQVENNLSSSLPDKIAGSLCSITTNDLQQAIKKKQEDEDSDDGYFEYKKSARTFRIGSDDEDDDMDQADSAKKTPNILDPETDNDNVSHNISVSSSLSQVENNLSSNQPDKNAESPCSTTTDNFQQAVKNPQDDDDPFKYQKSAKKFRIDSDEEGDDIDQLVESSSGHELNGTNGNDSNCKVRNEPYYEANIESSLSPTDKDGVCKTNNDEID